METIQKKAQNRCCHTGAKGINNDIIIIGGHPGDDAKDFCMTTFCIAFKPYRLKSLQHQAMQVIGRNKNELPWQVLPNAMIHLLGFGETLFKPKNPENQAAVVDFKNKEKQSQPKQRGKKTRR